MDLAAQTDIDLLRRYANTGDATAMAEVIRRYAGMVFGVAKRVTHDSHEAEDITQSCFLELLRRAPSWPDSKEVTSAAGWIHSTALHRAMDVMRNKNTRLRHERDAAKKIQTTEQDEWWQELAPRVDAAIDELPENLKTPLILHFLQGLSQAEISQHLKTSQPTISRRLEQAVQTLRSRLRDTELVGAVAALPALLGAHGVTVAPATLTASLGKMAVAGVGTHALAVPAPAAIAGSAKVSAWLASHALAIVATSVVVIAAGWATVHYATQSNSNVPASGTISSSTVAVKEEEEPDFLAAELILYSADPARAAAWYRDRLGFTIDSQSASAAKVHRDLCHITVSPTGVRSGNIAIAELEDLEEFHKEFVSRAVVITFPPTRKADTVEMIIKDLDGNVLTLTSPQ